MSCDKDKLQELKDNLEKIGWSIIDVGCDMYRILNQKGDHTVFELWDNSIQMRDGDAFGRYGRGSFRLNLDEVTYKFNKDGLGLNVMANDNCFLAFYNFEDEEPSPCKE